MINEYQTQNELNPKLWIDGEFNNKLRVQLLKIARAFYKGNHKKRINKTKKKYLE